MKKTVSKSALVKEAAYLDSLKNIAKGNPIKVCRK